MTRGRYATFPSPAVLSEVTPVQSVDPRRFALTLEDGCSYLVDLTGWPGTLFNTEIAPLVRGRIQRMGPSLVRNSVRQMLQNLRRFWVFLSERGAMTEALMDLTVELIDDYETWLEQHAGGRIYQRHLMAALIGVLRVGAEENEALLPSALLPRLCFLGHGPVGGSIPRDAYSGRIAEALRVTAKSQILEAQSRIALGENLPRHPVEVVACPMMAAHRDVVLAEIAAHGRIATNHPAFKRFVNMAARRKIDIGIEVPHRGFHLVQKDLAAFLILLALETGTEAESLIGLKADCLVNPTKGYVEIAYHKRRSRGSEWKRLRVRDGGATTPGGLIRLALALTDRARRHLESDRLWVLWTVTGLRPASDGGPHGLDAFAADHGLMDAALRLGRIKRMAVSANGGELASRPVVAHGVLADIENEIAHDLAGRAAERLVFGKVSAGAGGPVASDLSQATRRALAIETNWGLGELGPLWMPAPETVLMTDELLRARVRARLEAAEASAAKILTTQETHLLGLATELLEKRSISAHEILPWVKAIQADTMPDKRATTVPPTPGEA